VEEGSSCAVSGLGAVGLAAIFGCTLNFFLFITLEPRVE
jgi:Zn-dependent alcohol dehydrogenase